MCVCVGVCDGVCGGVCVCVCWFVSFLGSLAVTTWMCVHAPARTHTRSKNTGRRLYPLSHKQSRAALTRGWMSLDLDWLWCPVCTLSLGRWASRCFLLSMFVRACARVYYCACVRAKMVRDAFELAKEKSKGRGGAIIFIDEVRPWWWCGGGVVASLCQCRFSHHVYVCERDCGCIELMGGHWRQHMREREWGGGRERH